MRKLEKRHPHLRRNRPDSVFASASINFGPQVVTYEHTDSGNKANGICPIWCSGSFDYRKGGHLILRQLGKVLQFPPGSMILIPSATLMHGNVAIGPNETRVSFTQYSAGGLFRWVYYGFRGEKALKENKEAYARMLRERPELNKSAVAAFSKVGELHDDRVAAGLVKVSGRE